MSTEKTYPPRPAERQRSFRIGEALLWVRGVPPFALVRISTGKVTPDGIDELGYGLVDKRSIPAAFFSAADPSPARAGKRAFFATLRAADLLGIKANAE